MNEMRPPRAKSRKHDISAIASRYDRVALVLQGGGALGAYQIGVHQALAEAIGAINSAIIAGNGPEKRLARLCQVSKRMTHLPQPSWPSSGLTRGLTRPSKHTSSVLGCPFRRYVLALIPDEGRHWRIVKARRWPILLFLSALLCRLR
jgi:predicted acylesterase/phospholipase RssA